MKIIFESGKEILLRSYFKGTIIEINSHLVSHDYKIINLDPENDGFFLIVNLH